LFGYLILLQILQGPPGRYRGHNMVTLINISTSDRPSKERFGYWQDVLSQMLAPVKLRSDDPAGFRASASMFSLGEVQVSRVISSSTELYRTPQLVRQSDPEAYQVTLTLRGRGGVEQSRHGAGLSDRDLVIYDTSRPFYGWARAVDGPAEGVMLVLPRSALPLPDDKVRQLIATRLRGDTGVGALLSNFATGLLASPESYTETDEFRLSTILVDLLAVVLAHHLDEAQRVPVDSRERALLTSICAFIEQRLGHPDLTPTSIAAAHHISLRYLHKLFHQHRSGTTVAAWVRQRRLERCRRDLADPALRHVSVQQVVAHWGFADGNHFSRAFKAAYGIPPTAYRRSVLPG
jgi:AraC-like DNA-binding protein